MFCLKVRQGRNNFLDLLHKGKYEDRENGYVIFWIRNMKKHLEEKDMAFIEELRKNYDKVQMVELIKEFHLSLQIS